MRIIFIVISVLVVSCVFDARPGFASYDVTGGDAVIGLPADTSDGIRFLDGVNRTATVTVDKVIGVIAATPPLSVSTATNNMGTLRLQGNTTVNGDIGATGAVLLAVDVGAAGTSSAFNGDINAGTVNITGTGDATINGDLNGALSYDGAGAVTMADNSTITGAVTNDTGVNRRGTLTLAGRGTVLGQVGGLGSSLLAVNAGADASTSTFFSDIYTQSMNITGAGVVILNGDLNGALSYAHNGVVRLTGSSNIITGNVTNDSGTDEQGTLTFDTSVVVLGQVGAKDASLFAVNAGANGSSVTLSGNIHAKSTNITGRGVLVVDGDLYGKLGYLDDGTVILASDNTIYGTVTNNTGIDHQGTLTLDGNGTASGQVGSVGASLKTVNAGEDGTSSIFQHDVHTQTMNITGTGDVTLKGMLNGALSYDADGTMILADGATIIGAVTNDTGTDGRGTLTLDGTGTVFGQVGSSGASLKAVNAGVNGSGATFSNNVFTQTMNITGTGAVMLDGDLNGALGYGADGTVVLGNNAMITGTVTNNTGLDQQGTLTLAGNAAMMVQVGGAGASLKAVNAGANTSSSTFSSDVYAQSMYITGTGSVSLNAALHGALSYKDDGTLTLGNNMTITGAVTNGTGTDEQGTLTLAGSAAMSVPIGTTGASLKAVNAGANGSNSTFSGNVYTQSMNITGAGAVALDGDLNGALSYGNNGVVRLADGKTITGTVSNDSGVNFQGELDLIGTHTTGGTIGIVGGNALGLIAIRQGTFTMAHDVAAGVISVDQNAVLALSGDRTITDGSLIVGNTGNCSVDLGVNTLTLNNGGVNFASGTTINLTVSGPSTYGRIVQAAADAVVNPGTTINVNVTGYIPHGTVLTVIDGNAGSGVAGGLTVLGNDMIVNFIVSAVAGPDLILTVFVNYDPAGFGGSTRTVADTLAIIEGQSVSPDMRSVFTELHNAPTAVAVSQAVAQMRPYEGTAIVDETSALSFNGRRAAAAHLDIVRNNARNAEADRRLEMINSALDQYEGPVVVDSEPDKLIEADLWVQGTGMRSSQDAHSGVAGYSAVAQGIIMGVDLLKMERMIFGFAGGYASDTIDPDQFGIGDIDIEHYPLILYAELNGIRPWHIDAALSAARDKYKIERTIRFGAIDRIARSVFNGQQYGLYIEGAYDFAVSSLKLSPSVILDYSYMSIDGYTETGADALNLKVDPQDYSHMRSGFGLTASTWWDLARVRIMPQVYGKYFHEWLGPSIQTTASFNGTNNSFQTTGMKSARDMIETGMSCEFALPKQMSLRFNYDAELSQDYTSNILSAQFKSKF